jgi:predicted dinucleotide-binding enzyme
MKMAILGTGPVGNLIASRLIENGHQVMMGGRAANNEKGLAFVASHPGGSAHYGTFEQAADSSDVVFNATNGRFFSDALRLAKTDFEDKIIVDVANSLDFSTQPPTLLAEYVNTNSIGETIQKQFPKAKVVKTLNTLPMVLAVSPVKLKGGDHSLFMAGNDEGAKTRVKMLVTEFGWNLDNIVDLGDITAARGMEMYLMLFSRLNLSLKMRYFNIKVIKE